MATTINPPLEPFAAFEGRDENALFARSMALMVLGYQLAGVTRTQLGQVKGINYLAGLSAPIELQFERDTLRGRYVSEKPHGGPSRRNPLTLQPVLLKYTSADVRSPSDYSAKESILRSVYEAGSPAAAIRLIANHKDHSSRLIRVVARYALGLVARCFYVVEDRSHPLEAVLDYSNALYQELVAADLDDFETVAFLLPLLARDHPGIQDWLTPNDFKTSLPPSRTAIIVHGTFPMLPHNAPDFGPRWWQPGGDFHTFIRQNVWPDVYSAQDCFRWSGQLSAEARHRAAQELVSWANDKDLRRINVVAHSHGANVVARATHLGLSVGTLVALSPPVASDESYPDFDNVDRVVSVRARFDHILTLLVLGSRLPSQLRRRLHPDLSSTFDTTYGNPRIEEHVLPIHGHSLSHDPAIWREHNLALRLELASSGRHLI